MIRDTRTNEMIFTYGDALEAISPPAKGNGYYYVSKKVDGVPQHENYDNIVWSDTNTDPKPLEADVKAKFIEIVKLYNAQAYARSRKVEYDALNQFELISDDDVNGTTTHKDAIAAIKIKYPKPE